MNWDLAFTVFNFIWGLVLAGWGVMGIARGERRYSERIRELQRYSKNLLDDERTLLYWVQRYIRTVRFDILLHVFLLSSGNVIVGIHLCTLLGTAQ